ncbi:MAG TPA: ABC transporter permease [Candidatus Acidoferrum sp.]|nr:ABC transporter permease [Candidatus Acidoferrum sp.]
MFARLLFRLIYGSRGRLAVALVAVVSGAAVVSALLNLSFDIERKLSEEFQTLGANVVIAPRPGISSRDAGSAAATLINKNEVMAALHSSASTNILAAAPFLFVVARVSGTPVVLTGTWLDESSSLAPTWKITGHSVDSRDDALDCLVGANVAQRFLWNPGDAIELRYLENSATFQIAGIVESGDTADDQIFVNLSAAQALAGLPGRISLAQLSVSPNPSEISAVVAGLQAALPALQVSPIRQVAEAQGELLHRIHLLVISMVALILVLTALCILATMAALAMERRVDVGLMKALGGSITRVMAFFVAEVALLAAAGGLLGWVSGIGLSEWMGRRVFGAAISPHWQILPATISLVIAVAIAGAMPLRALGRVKPAVILRGD